MQFGGPNVLFFIQSTCLVQNHSKIKNRNHTKWPVQPCDYTIWFPKSPFGNTSGFSEQNSDEYNLVRLIFFETFSLSLEKIWSGGEFRIPCQQMVWILQLLYYRHCGTIVGSMEDSLGFDIAAGVQQGRVFSPHLFCSILGWPLSKRRAQGNGVGYDFQDGGISLLDLRFADDVLVCAKSYEEIGHVLDMLVDAFRKVGFVLNAGKNKKTAQSQHPAELPVELASSGGIGVQILERDRGQSGRAVWLFLNDQLSHGWQPRTWSGTPLPSCIHGSLRKHIGINWEDYVHCKSINLFWRYGYTSCLFGKWPSQNLQTSPSQDLASWTSNSANPCAPLWALLGASIGLLHGTTSSTSGTHACWNVLKCDEMCWPSWRQIMVRRCLEQHRQLANYIFNLLDNRWLKRALAWTAGRRTRIGRPTHTHMGCANINWLPMAKFWRMEGNSNANRFLADTYGFLYWIFDAEVMRV